MTYRSQTGQRKSSGQKFQKSAHEKAKSKAKKQKITSGYYAQEQPEQSTTEITQKTLNSLNRLGTQVFALSPFSQYFDEWLRNLKMTVSEFESNQQITVDAQWEKERTQTFIDIERELAEKRIQETTMNGNVKALQDSNHRIVELDVEYAQKNRELSTKRNSDVQQLSNQVHELEDALSKEEAVKIGRFNLGLKRKHAKQISQLTKNLNMAKSELDLTLQNFEVEQEKLHDDYEQKKQEVINQVQALEKKLEMFETDTSTQVRKAACNALTNAVTSLVQRMPTAEKPETDFTPEA